MPPDLFSWDKEKSAAPVRNADDHYVLFRIADRIYAFPLFQVTRVLRMVALTALPEMPVWLAGILNMAGETVPVVNLRQLLGHQRKDPELQDRLLIVPLPTRQIAVPVDEVLGIEEYLPEQVEPLPPDLSPAGLPAAVIKDDGMLILLLDPQGLFTGKIENWDDVKV